MIRPYLKQNKGKASITRQGHTWNFEFVKLQEYRKAGLDYIELMNNYDRDCENKAATETRLLVNIITFLRQRG